MMPSKKDKHPIGKYNTLLSAGSPLKLPYYSVIGTRQSFYLWHQADKDDRGNHTKWIVGKEAFDLLSKLRTLRAKDRDGFIELFMQEYNRHPKQYNW